ncbi:uncharacterized protein LOC126268137 [Schistocerca gregaria]|uniref:uncharacterized protein LOC126268137 n=1 Tax=Schistocerca gregaria TaxID=7010 RepID=UPI00211E949B|nr:uncharacterized protein LOC126268137 [Schistocerca gregaria]
MHYRMLWRWCMCVTEALSNCFMRLVTLLAQFLLLFWYYFSLWYWVTVTLLYYFSFLIKVASTVWKKIIMLSHLGTRLSRLQLKTLCIRHCITVRTSWKSTGKLQTEYICAEPLLEHAVYRVDQRLGMKTWASPHLEEKIRKQDKLSSDYTLIYRAPMINYVKVAQGLCTGPPLVFCGLLTANYFSDFLFAEVKDSYFGLTLDQSDMMIFLVSYFLFNVVLYSFISRYALRIYSNKDHVYKTIFQGLLPWNTKELSFKKGDIVRKPSLYFLPWKDSQYSIGKKKVILLEQYFRRPVDLHDMFKN